MRCCSRGAALVLAVVAALHFGAGTATGQGLGLNNANPHASSILDLKATNRGLLIPRMLEAEKNAIATPATGLLVFQANGAAGFYFYNGSAWVALSTAASGWGVSGNAGTVNGTNFLGTTDAQDLDFKTNNVIRARFTQQGQLEILNTGNSVFIGERAGANDDLSTNANVFVGYYAGNANTTGWFNVANGAHALEFNTTGSSNTANGYHALYRNIAGSNATAIGTYAMLNANNTGTPFTNYNVAVGYQAMYGSATPANNTGNYNTALGYQSLMNYTTGGNNTALGYSAGDINTTGGRNTFVGYNADAASNALTNATAIGANASVSASNTIQLGDASVTSVATSGALTTGAVAYPNTDGIFGQVLTTDGAGTADWRSTTAFAWGVTGNAGTTNGTDFIGTTDAQDLDIRTNNVIRHRFTQQGQIEVLNTGQSVFIGEGAGANDDLSTNANVFVGHQAGNANTTGANNTATGWYALKSNTTGSANTATGRLALWLSTGTGNTALGYMAGNINTTGSSNTFVGYDADAASNALTNATAIGANASVSASNKIQLGDASITSVATAGKFSLEQSAGDEMVIINDDLWTHGNSGSQDFGDGGNHFIMASKEGSTETAGIYGDGDHVTIWSAGDGAPGLAAAYLYILDEDLWNDADNNPFNNTALKIYLNNTGTWVASDENRKENIDPLPKGSLSKLLQLSGYSYNFKLHPAEIEKGDTKKTTYGVIAQEVAQVFPEIVDIFDDGSHFVNYSLFVPVLIESVKEQQTIIDGQKEEINVLHAQITEIQQTLRAMGSE